MNSSSDCIYCDSHGNIDWDKIDMMEENERMWEVLKVLPKSKWGDKRPDCPSWTLLDSVVYGNNPAALVKLLQSGLFNIKDYEFKEFDTDSTIAYELAEWNDYEMLKVVCAAGAYLTAMYSYGYSKMLTDTALTVSSRHSVGLRCAKLLIASGCRIEHEKARFRTIPIRFGERTAEIGNEKELQAFQDGVVECRKTVIALLAMKRRQNTSAKYIRQWVKYDRFMIREIAMEVWSTRSVKNEFWQINP